MKAGLMAGTLLATAAFVITVQYRHQRTYPEPAALLTESRSLEDREPVDIWIFGRAYPESRVQAWFAKVEAKYCSYGDRLYKAGTVPGKPMSYDEFVLALQQGFFFPELAGLDTNGRSGDSLASLRPQKDQLAPPVIR